VGRKSPLSFVVSHLFVKYQSSGQKVPAAPKRFAAGIGFVFSLAIGWTFLSGWTIVTWCLSGMLLVCAVLESGFSICLGCFIYTFVMHIISWIKNGISKKSILLDKQ
jgi:hypothetical protein